MSTASAPFLAGSLFAGGSAGDTIVALASAPGASVLGIVRLSGPRAIAMADRLFLPAGGAPLRERSGRQIVSGSLRVDLAATLCQTPDSGGIRLYSCPCFACQKNIFVCIFNKIKS